MKRLLLCFLATFGHWAWGATLQNDIYAVTTNPDRTMTISVAGVPSQTLVPEFTVMFSATDPVLDSDHDNYLLTPRTAVLWTGYEDSAANLNTYLNSSAVQTDLLYPVTVSGSSTARVWTWYTDATRKTVKLSFTGRYAAGTTDPFLVGTKYTMTAETATLAGTRITWTFTNNPAYPFTLAADLDLQPGNADPRISIHLNVRTAGYFSAALTGAPALAANQTKRVDQETAGTSFRLFNYVVSEANAHMPHVYLSSTGGWTAALVLDPTNMPFLDPTSALPRAPYDDDSCFGLLLKKDYAAGTFRPIILAPLMGGSGSLMSAGAAHHSTVLYVLRSGDWKAVYRDVAQRVYGNLDARDNTGTGSLNRTFDRLVDFLANRNGQNFAMWHEEQKYYDYVNDNSGCFKPFSPNFGLATAIVTDDEQLYRTRARPQVEFALSRNANYFAPYVVINAAQISAVNLQLGTPYLGSAELVTLHGLYQNRNQAIRHYADEKGYASSDFPQLLAKYSLTGSAGDLNAALADANTDYNADPTGARDDCMDWLDIWEASGSTLATRNSNYLNAAVYQMYDTAMSLINLSPKVPDQNVLIDVGGKAPLHAQTAGRHVSFGFPKPAGYPTPEQTVSAWRVALNGLQSTSYRGEFWMNYHGHFMRIGAVNNDPFLQSIARWGMVGRFAHYPGDNRSAPSLVIERPDLAEHPLWQMTHTTFNPGHAWEFSAAVLDFLVSDVFARSLQAVSFPSRSMYKTSFRVRLYGDRPGRFYGDNNVWLWMPRGLALPDNPQVDYLSAYGNGKLYLAFVNQSASTQSVSVALDPNRADVQLSHAANWWKDNVSQGSTTIAGKQINFSIAPRGIVAYAINGVSVNRMLHQKMFDPAAPVLGAASLQRTSLSVGSYPAVTNITGMLLSLGKGLTHAFIYSSALPANTQSARLEYRQGVGAWQQKTDAIFPYEFSVDYVEGAGDFQYIYHVTTANGVEYGTPTITLSAGSIPPQAPQPPSDLAARVGDTRLLLTWTESTGATSYNVKRALGSGGPFTSAASGVTSTTFTDTGLDNGTTYYYVVSAVNAAGESADSGQISRVPRATPSGLTATAQLVGSVLLTWAPVSGATSYLIKRTNVGGGPYDGPFKTIAAGVTGTSYTDFAPNLFQMTCRYVVVAVFGSGESAESAPVSVIPNPLTIVLDDADTNGVAVTGTWTVSATSVAYKGSHRYASGTIAGRSVVFTPTIQTPGFYDLYGWWSGASTRDSGAPFEVTDATGTHTVSVNQRANSGQWNCLGTFRFNPGTNGNVNVHSHATADGSISADAVMWRYATNNVAAPVPPTGLVATPGEAQVSLRWNPVSGALNYLVKRAASAGGPYTNVATGIGATDFTDMGLGGGTPVYYVVSTVNASGEGANSTEVSALPLWPKLGISTAPGFISLNWATGSANYPLLGATNLAPPVTWHQLTNAPVSTNGLLQLDLPTDSPQRFYRLANP